MISWTLKGLIKEYRGKKRYHEQYYDHKFDNLGEMEQFLEFTLCQNTQEETDNLNRLISNINIKSVFFHFLLPLCSWCPQLGEHLGFDTPCLWLSVRTKYNDHGEP